MTCRCRCTAPSPLHGPALHAPSGLTHSQPTPSQAPITPPPACPPPCRHFMAIAPRPRPAPACAGCTLLHPAAPPAAHPTHSTPWCARSQLVRRRIAARSPSTPPLSMQLVTSLACRPDTACAVPATSLPCDPGSARHGRGLNFDDMGSPTPRQPASRHVPSATSPPSQDYRAWNDGEVCVADVPPSSGNTSDTRRDSFHMLTTRTTLPLSNFL